MAMNKYSIKLLHVDVNNRAVPIIDIMNSIVPT